MLIAQYLFELFQSTPFGSSSASSHCHHKHKPQCRYTSSGTPRQFRRGGAGPAPTRCPGLSGQGHAKIRNAHFHGGGGRLRPARPGSTRPAWPFGGTLVPRVLYPGSGTRRLRQGAGTHSPRRGLLVPRRPRRQQPTFLFGQSGEWNFSIELLQRSDGHDAQGRVGALGRTGWGTGCQAHFDEKV